MPLCHGSLTRYNDGPLRPLQVPFKSRVPQRPKQNVGPELGPGAYSPKPGQGCPGAASEIIDPQRQSQAFASKSKKAALKKPPGADVDWPPAHVAEMRHLPRGPGSHPFAWPHGERKPPFFHVPFKAYPGLCGEPRGRSKGLDEIYDNDATGATPIGLNGTMGVNMKRSPRRYSIMSSKVPARPKAADLGSAGELGPGWYNLARNGIDLKDPQRPSSAFVKASKGMYEGVGGSYSDWLGILLPKKHEWEL